MRIKRKQNEIKRYIIIAYNQSVVSSTVAVTIASTTLHRCNDVSVKVSDRVCLSSLQYIHNVVYV